MRSKTLPALIVALAVGAPVEADAIFDLNAFATDSSARYGLSDNANTIGSAKSTVKTKKAKKLKGQKKQLKGKKNQQLSGKKLSKLEKLLSKGKIKPKKLAKLLAKLNLDSPDGLPVNNTSGGGGGGTTQQQAVPEPGSMLLLGMGLAGLSAFAFRRKRS